MDVVRRADVCDLPAVFAGRSLKRVAAHADVVPAPDAVAPVPAIRSSTCPSIVKVKACGRACPSGAPPHVASLDNLTPPRTLGEGWTHAGGWRYES